MYRMQFVVQHYSPVLSIAGGSETDNGLTGSAHCPLPQPGSVRNFIVLLQTDPAIQHCHCHFPTSDLATPVLEYWSVVGANNTSS